MKSKDTHDDELFCGAAHFSAGVGSVTEAEHAVVAATARLRTA